MAAQLPISRLTIWSEPLMRRGIRASDTPDANNFGRYESPL